MYKTCNRNIISCLFCVALDWQIQSWLSSTLFSDDVFPTLSSRRLDGILLGNLRLVTFCLAKGGCKVDMWS